MDAMYVEGSSQDDQFWDEKAQGEQATSLQTHPPSLEESNIVERVARIVSTLHGKKPDYAQLAAELAPAVPFDVFGVVLLRHDRVAVRVTACIREAGSWRTLYHQHPLEDSKVADLLHRLSTSAKNDPLLFVENYLDGLDGPPAVTGDVLNGYPHLRATFIAPLLIGERMLGTLELGSTLCNAYDDPTLQRLIAAVVRVLAAAIESAQVGGSAEIQDRQRQVLKEVSSALNSNMDLSSIFRQIVDGIANALNVASAIVTIGLREARTLHVEAQSGLDAQKLSRLVEDVSALSEKAIIGCTLQRRQPALSQDIASDVQFPLSRAFATELNIHSISSYPLANDTRVYGALLLFSPEPGGFTPLKGEILSLFANQATIAIHNATLLEAAQQRSRFQEMIEQLEQAYTHDVDEQEMLEQVRKEVEATFGVRLSSILRFISAHLLTQNERNVYTVSQPTLQQERDIA
ncbi:MAG: GAF domain-containing protein, partial [Chloroflexota bacterium]|nr:GAF domain-containing protein [Chloroflexota bacterium]